jgi:hypothetical protein
MFPFFVGLVCRFDFFWSGVFPPLWVCLSEFRNWLQGSGEKAQTLKDGGMRRSREPVHHGSLFQYNEREFPRFSRFTSCLDFGETLGLVLPKYPVVSKTPQP